ncbi:hypothetical protein QJS10_CPB04g01539 [Acorus calamus]|uniref:Uncharacterized protein n=1 Tax=Acorus calamus TaxID=4465 RepID=A0AAV9EZ95_ACOCL|nr:hypothetical protein QJS10_CPB04g01539 [Acorus calamus]
MSITGRGLFPTPTSWFSDTRELLDELSIRTGRNNSEPVTGSFIAKYIMKPMLINYESKKRDLALPSIEGNDWRTAQGGEQTMDPSSVAVD